MLTIEKLIEEMQPLHNDICILYDSVLARLVGVADDGDDFYYVVREQQPKGECLASAVGHIISLRTIYPADRYAYMDRVFELNGAPKSEEFVVRLVS